jgi:hypothetical protein
MHKCAKQGNINIAQHNIYAKEYQDFNTIPALLAMRSYPIF